MVRNKLITTRQAAEVTGYDRRYIAQLCQKGKIEGAGRTPGKYGHEDWFVPLGSLFRYQPEERPNAHPHTKKTGA